MPIFNPSLHKGFMPPQIKRAGLLIPTPASVGAVDGVIFDIARQQLGNKKGNEELGDNLVTNGDFNDFTMDDDSNTVGRWVFSNGYHTAEETGDTKGDDLSGNGNDLTPNGDIENTEETEPLPQFLVGEVDDNRAKAPKMDGVNDYWYIPAAQATDFNPGTGDFTIETTRTFGNITGLYPIFGKFYTGSTPGYMLAASDDAHLRFYLIESSGNRLIRKYDVSSLSGRTVHLSATIEGATRTIKLYENGVELSGTDFVNVGSTPIDVDNNNDFTIGYVNGLGYSDGADYEIRYSNTARSAQEIKESYGLAKEWTWDNTGDISNDEFQQVVSGGGVVSQEVSTISVNLYKVETDEVAYINETDYDVELGNGTWDDITLQKVLNASWDDGTTAIDYGGLDNNGTMSGSLETDGILQHPAALEFDGVNDYISHPDISMNAANAWLWEAFVDLTLGSVQIISGDDSSNNGGIRIDADGSIIFIESGGTLRTFAYNLTSVYTRVSIYADGSGNIDLYINGEFEETISGASTDIDFNNLGRGYGSVNYLLDGFAGYYDVYKWTSDYGKEANLIKKIYNNTCEIFGKDKI